VRAVADAAARWADADFPPRVRLLERIVQRTGYTTPVVEYALDRLFESFTGDELESTIARELGSIDALDAFVEREGRPRARALPAGNACIISSRSTIGVAIVPAVFALCAKCDVLVKDREDGLVRAFFATLGEELDALAGAARAEVWESASGAVDLGEFDVVVAFGNDATLVSIRAGLGPRASFVGFGSRASVGYVAREALVSGEAAAKIAAGAARDLVLYESEGCLSLHALFVERGGAVDPPAFTSLLAREVERAARAMRARPRVLRRSATSPRFALQAVRAASSPTNARRISPCSTRPRVSRRRFSRARWRFTRSTARLPPSPICGVTRFRSKRLRSPANAPSWPRSRSICAPIASPRSANSSIRRSAETTAAVRVSPIS